MQDNSIFDVVIIGSSPLLLFEALRQRRKGRSVAIVEREDRLGGAWATGDCEVGDAIVHHELACHLFEWQPHGYALLEDLSGWPFDLLDPKPVKIWDGGKVADYSSRAGYAKSYLLSWVSLALAVIRIIQSLLRRGSVPPDLAERLRSTFRILRDDSVLRLPGVISFDGLRGPRGGVARFIVHLAAEVNKRGVVVLTGQRVVSLESRPELLRLTLSTGQNLQAREVTVSESAAIESLTPAFLDHYSPFRHVLIGIPAADVRIRSAYVHFVDNPLLHRLTFVEDVQTPGKDDLGVFLLQTRSHVEDPEILRSALASLFDIYPVADSLSGLRILKQIEGHFVPARSKSIVKTGFIDDDRVNVISTIGDLTKNAVLNSRSRKPEIVVSAQASFSPSTPANGSG